MRESTSDMSAALSSRSRAAIAAGSRRRRYSPFIHLSFSGSKRAGELAHVLEVEPLDQLLAREHLLVAVRPAQAREVVHQRVGQEAVVAVLHHAHRAVALGQALAVGAEDHRHVRELRQRRRRAR